MLSAVLVVLFSLFAALCNRGAGGLWSYWLKTDIGATGPRMLYGLSTTLPVLWFGGLTLRWCLVWLVGGVLQGLCRGTGWHGSLDLGLTGQTVDEAQVRKKMLVMALCGLGFYAPLSAVAGYQQDLWYLGLLLWAATFPIFLVASYLTAECLRVEIPLLQCYKTDFPPFGEILSAFVCEIIFCCVLGLPK